MRAITVLLLAVISSLAVPRARAEIVYVNMPDVVLEASLPPRDLFGLDIDRDHHPDLRFFTGWVEDSGGTPRFHIGVYGEDLNQLTSNGDFFLRGLRDSENIPVQAIPWGTSGGWLLTDQDEGDWGSRDERFLGFLFHHPPAGGYVVGWLRIRATNTTGENLAVTLYDYGYENQLGRDIRAGEGVVGIEPATWGALKLLYARP